MVRCPLFVRGNGTAVDRDADVDGAEGRQVTNLPHGRGGVWGYKKSDEQELNCLDSPVLLAACISEKRSASSASSASSTRSFKKAWNSRVKRLSGESASSKTSSASSKPSSGSSDFFGFLFFGNSQLAGAGAAGCGWGPSAHRDRVLAPTLAASATAADRRFAKTRVRMAKYGEFAGNSVSSLAKYGDKYGAGRGKYGETADKYGGSRRFSNTA